MISTRITRAVSCALGLLLGACTSPAPEENIASTQLAEGEDDAYVSWHSLPATMNCGEERQITVEMMNYGVTWEPGNYFLKAFQGPAPFEAPSQIDLDHPVAFGELYEFSFPLRAPSYAVTARSQWRMYGPGWFGDIAGDSPDPPIQVNCSTPEDRARVVGVDFPGSVECGETFDASVTFSNDGQTTWSPNQQYRLQANPGNPFHGPSRVDVGGNVDPGHSYTFDMTLTAPSAAGNYPNSWQMTSDAGGLFHDVFNRSIQVNCENPEDSAAISHNIPPAVQCGGHFSFQVTVTNTGTTTWTSQGYRLRLTEDSVPLGDPIYYFPHAIGRNESHTFSIVMHGPPAADRYYVAFQMFNANTGEWFGPRAERNIESTCNWENARVLDHGLVPEVNCGEPYLIRVKMQNTGLWTWKHEEDYRLKNVGSLPFHPFTPHIRVPPNVEVPSGSEHTFETVLTAPFVNGRFPYGWQMSSWTGGEFGQRLFGWVDVRCAPDNSKLTGVALPTELQCGQIYPASLTLQNRGTQVWATAWDYKLGALGGTDPFGPAQVPIPGFPVVYPGDSKTFQFNMTGPYVPPGDYPSDWSMFHGNVPFGEREERQIRLNCSPLDVRLVRVAALGSTSCDPEVELFVTVKNNGFGTWGVSAGVVADELSFVQTTPLSPFALVERVPLAPGVKVAPGQTYTFPVRFRRAEGPGLRAMSRWRMRIDRAGGGDRDDSVGPELFGPTMRIPVPRFPRFCE